MYYALIWRRKMLTYLNKTKTPDIFLYTFKKYIILYYNIYKCVSLFQYNN